MRNYLVIIFVIFFQVNSSFSQEKEGSGVSNVEDVTMKEIVIKAKAQQDLNDKVWDMGYYYYCKFSRSDEKQAMMDGWILLTPHRMEEIRRRAVEEHNVQIQDVYIINGVENNRYGTYELCAGGVLYTYVRRGSDEYQINKKSTQTISKKEVK